MRPLISDEINNKLNEIVTACFLGNRIADRGMSILSTKFVMNHTEELLHDRLAHLFPMLGDIVSSYQAARNNLTVYGLTPLDDADYDSPLDFFRRMVNYMLELENAVSACINMCRETDNFTYAFLLEFVEEIIPVTEQCLLLLDKAETYDRQWQDFDKDIDIFITLPSASED